VVVRRKHVPLTKEQASQIDWEALLKRLVNLREPLARWLERVSAAPHGADGGLAVALADILSTVEYIELALTPAMEGEGDATTS
jgi:hypothetical protein